MTSETQKSDPPYVAYQWWEALNGKWEGTRQTGEDRAALARLRRASPDEAMCEEATLRLFRALGYKSPDYLPRVATLAAVLATIRDDGRGRFGRQIGREKIEDDQTARLKIGRFKRLLDAQTEDEIATAFRRAIAILGGAANVREVAKYVLFFDDERTRRQLSSTITAPAKANQNRQKQKFNPLLPPPNSSLHKGSYMKRFVQLHLLTFYPPSNLNRDDTGKPKTAIIGGATRLRISSQALKRAWRTSDIAETILARHLGKRTQRIGSLVLDHLRGRIDDAKALEIAREVASAFGKVKAETDKNPEFTEQLAFVSPEEREAALALPTRAPPEQRPLRKRKHSPKPCCAKPTPQPT